MSKARCVNASMPVIAPRGVDVAAGGVELLQKALAILAPVAG